MKTQFIITDLLIIDGQVISDISPAKFVEIAFVPDSPVDSCTWCGCHALKPKLDITQYEFFGLDKCYLVCLCTDCLKATVYVYANAPISDEVNGHE